MALFDVAKTVTFFQRLCQFAEEFTEEHRDPLVASLNKLFRSDLPDAEQDPDVLETVNSLIRRLRRTLDNLVQAEIELIGAFKESIAFRQQRDELVAELRVVFDRARSECRNHFTRAKADAAGFPARLSDEPRALGRQTKLVSWTLRRDDFDLGDAVIPSSTTTAESILEIYEPKAEELETVLADAVRRQAKPRGKQVVKDREMADFRATYSVFVGILRGAFRLAGQSEIANRLTLNQIGRTTSSPSQPSEDETEPTDPQSEDTPSDNTPSDDTPSERGGEEPPPVG